MRNPFWRTIGFASSETHRLQRTDSVAGAAFNIAASYGVAVSVKSRPLDHNAARSACQPGEIPPPPPFGKGGNGGICSNGPVVVQSHVKRIAIDRLSSAVIRGKFGPIVLCFELSFIGGVEGLYLFSVGILPSP
jgi:hypothetical protein